MHGRPYKYRPIREEVIDISDPAFMDDLDEELADLGQIFEKEAPKY